MGKKNYIKYLETDDFSNVVKPQVVSTAPISLFPAFSQNYFKNDSPVILELGCGRGEYTVGLARKYPEKNFIGIDIKTSRLWHGASAALSEGLANVLFVTLKIELVADFFPENSVSEIWVPFPEPKIQRLSGNKCLTSPRFFSMYKKIMKPHGVIHVKTDDDDLFAFTRKSANDLSLKTIKSTQDLYADTGHDEDLTSIKTRYEKKYLAAVKTIKYLKLSFN